MRVYRNQQTGLTVVSGNVKSISEDRMVMVVTSEERDRGTNKNIPVEYTVSSGVPYEEDFKAGFSVTAVGYPHGKGTLMAESVLVGNDIFETQELSIVAGLVKFARLNEEKNADGTPKLKQDGSPKQPHYDITVTVNEDGKWVDHVIKVYNGNTEAGQKSPIEKMTALFGRFDKENNRIRVSFVTKPGQYSSYTVNKNGNEYVNNVCYHMGYNSMDIEYLDSKEKTQNAPQAQNTPAQPTQTQTPVQTAPTPNVPVNTGAGFDASLEMEEDEMFK